MEKRVFTFYILLLTLVSAIPAFADSWKKGIAAYRIENYDEALDQFFFLSDQGHAGAQFNLGVMYSRGIAVKKNSDLAVKYFTLAAEQGLLAAQTLLGSMYRVGKGVIQNHEAAIKWYTLAAEQGNADAHYYLGVMYRRGKLKNYIYAHMWWSIAASLGDKMAVRSRHVIEKAMTTAQIAQARELAKLCVEKKYKLC